MFKKINTTKNYIKSLILNIIFKSNFLLSRLYADDELRNFIAKFREKYVSCELVCIGGDGDGSYLVPNDLHNVKYCFSPGVDYSADFEKELSDRFGIKSFLADASVTSAPIDNQNFVFLQKFIGSANNPKYITLSDWIYESIGNDSSKKILQMDIEGGEYDVFSFEDSSTLASFSTLIIEFHNLERLFNKPFLQIFSSIFEKIYKNFSICHVHPNNGCGLLTIKDITVPKVMEVTFIRNDLLANLKTNNEISLPHSLDSKNAPDKPDIVMPELWWKHL